MERRYAVETAEQVVSRVDTTFLVTSIAYHSFIAYRKGNLVTTAHGHKKIGPNFHCQLKVSSPHFSTALEHWHRRSFCQQKKYSFYSSNKYRQKFVTVSSCSEQPYDDSFKQTKKEQASLSFLPKSDLIVSQPVFLIDALALIYRAHYALVKAGLSTSYGLQTGPIYGFASSLLSIMEEYSPSCMLVVFDNYVSSQSLNSLSVSQPRKMIYPNYKGNRTAMPFAIEQALPFIKALVSLLGISLIEVANTEADDVIGTITNFCSTHSCFSTVTIVSADKDFLQLLRQNQCQILRPRKTSKDQDSSKIRSKRLSSWIIMTEEDFRQEYEDLAPYQYCDILALTGDAVDNIPGIRGIGKKQAVKLIKQYQSIETLVENWKNQMLLNKSLVTIRQQVDIPQWRVEDMFLRPPAMPSLIPFLADLELKRLRERIDKYAKQSGQGNGLFSQLEYVNFEYFCLSTAWMDYTQAEDKWEQLLAMVRQKKIPHIAVWLDCDASSQETEDKHVSLSMTYLWKQQINLLSDRKERIVKGLVVVWEKNKGIYLDLHHMKEEWKQQLEWLLGTHVVSKMGVLMKEQLRILQLYSDSWSIKGPLIDHKIAYQVLFPHEHLSVEQVIQKYISLSKDSHSSHFLFLLTHANELYADDVCHLPSLYQWLHVSTRDKNRLIENTTEWNNKKLFRVWCQCIWTCLLFGAHDALHLELMNRSLITTVEWTEYPLIEILAKMESNGILVNSDQLQAVLDKVKKDITDSEQKLEQLAKPFPLELKADAILHLLKEKWKIRCMSHASLYKLDDHFIQRIRTFCSSTDSELLQFLDVLLQWVCAIKLKKNGLEVLQRSLTNGRIHPSIEQFADAFGKVMVVSPYLESMFENEAIRAVIELLFIAETNGQLLIVDYSQLEMRILASLTGEPLLVEAFRREQDIYRVIAKKVFPQGEHNENTRNIVKRLMDAMLIGHTANTLSQDLGINIQQAKDWMLRLRMTLPLVLMKLEDLIQQAREAGYSETLLGRKIPVPILLYSRNNTERAMAENTVRRIPLEATRADMIKLAMLRIAQRLQDMQSTIILQIYNQIVFQVPEIELQLVKEIVADETRNVLRFSHRIPVKTCIGIGRNWSQASSNMKS
eukprot:jgi/Galph1/72/GphlegSOOS_G4815.1